MLAAEAGNLSAWLPWAVLGVFAVSSVLVILQRRFKRVKGSAEIGGAKFSVEADEGEGGDGHASVSPIVPEVHVHVGDRPAGTPVTCRHEIPPPPGDFKGRGAELDELAAAVKEGGTTISGVRGMGGIGKSALAFKLAERLAPEFPDWQFYLDLKGTSETPRPVAEAMAHVIRGFRPDAKVPASDDDLAGLYRSILDGTRALLLMDNAADKEQVEPLAPPTGCALIVTSRMRFTLPSLHPIDLETLPPDEARALLLDICPTCGEHAAKIAELCGYLPFALRIAGSALEDNPNWTAEEYAERLDKTGLAEMGEQCLGVSHDILDEGLQRHFRLLGVFPTTFDRKAAAAVWAVEADAAATTLDELVRRNLVDCRGAGPDCRYFLHDIASAFAVARTKASEGGAARFRFALHYRTVLGQFHALMPRGAGGITEALGLSGAEWDNIQAGQGFAAEHTDSDEGWARLCASYPMSAPRILDFRLSPRERLSWYHASLSASQKLGNRVQEAGAHTGLGNTYCVIGDAELGATHFEKALGIGRVLHHGPIVASNLINLGMAHLRSGKADLAEGCLEEARGEMAHSGESEEVALLLDSLGQVYAQRGEMSKANDYYGQALQSARDQHAFHLEGCFLHRLGSLRVDAGSLPEALVFLDGALAIADKLGDRQLEAATLQRLAVVDLRLGHADKAIGRLKKSLAIARQDTMRTGEGAVLGQMGVALAKNGQLVLATEKFREALGIARSTADHSGELSSLVNLAQAEKMLGNAQAVIQYCDEVAAVVEGVDGREATRARNVVRELLAGLGDT